MKKGFTITYEYGENLYVNTTNRCNFNCEFCLRHNGHGGSIYTHNLWLEREPTREEALADLMARDLSQYRELVFCGFGEPVFRWDDDAWLIDELNAEQSDNPEQPTPKRGRPRKDAPTDSTPAQDTPRLDYTDKDAVLQELARIAERSEKESDKLAAIREISALQRMKQEAAVEDEKRVQFYIPLTYERAEELRQYLARYYAEKDVSTEG